VGALPVAEPVPGKEHLVYAGVRDRHLSLAAARRPRVGGGNRWVWGAAIATTQLHSPPARGRWDRETLREAAL